MALQAAFAKVVLRFTDLLKGAVHIAGLEVFCASFV